MKKAELRQKENSLICAARNLEIEYFPVSAKLFISSPPLMYGEAKHGYGVARPAKSYEFNMENIYDSDIETLRDAHSLFTQILSHISQAMEE